MVGPSLNTHHLTTIHKPTTIKFLCSYGGKILPRYPDGKLRYHGGQTRVLAVERSISFPELLVKLRELCGTTVSLRCQLPTEDLDALVSITSVEDLANLIEEYDRVPASPSFTLKIRAFLSQPKKVFPPTSSSSTSPNSSLSYTPVASGGGGGYGTIRRYLKPAIDHCNHRIPKPLVVPFWYEKSVGKLPQCAYTGHGNTSCLYLIHNGNYWQ